MLVRVRMIRQVFARDFGQCLFFLGNLFDVSGSSHSMTCRVAPNSVTQHPRGRAKRGLLQVTHLQVAHPRSAHTPSHWVLDVTLFYAGAIPWP
jgi:hypothetical protein